MQKNKIPFSVKLEDIHLNLESLLTEKIGPVGGKLHTGRSRMIKWQQICIYTCEIKWDLS